jgi:excisionase family DNA binding protein
VCNPDGDRMPEEVTEQCPDRRHRRPAEERAPGRARPLTLKETASYLNVTERYVRRLVTERRIPYFKVGRLLRFSAIDLDAFIESCRVEPPPLHPLARHRRPPSGS